MKPARRCGALPNPRMQPTGRKCPDPSLGATSRTDAAERKLVRARA